jgi:threonyl-tRNA synthetase
VALAGELNGKVRDLKSSVNGDSTLSILTFEDEGGRLAYRHTTSHIMAQAVKRLFKDGNRKISNY